MGGQAADCGSDDEAQAEGGADDPHAAGALRRRGDIRHVGLRGGDVAAGESRHDARDEQDGV